MPPTNPPFIPLTPTERRLLKIGELINETPFSKRMQHEYHAHVGSNWVHLVTRNLLHVEGLERVLALQPERGILLCANHRSFFDQCVLSMIIVRHAPHLARECYFPIRSEFFYERWSGLAVNLIMGGGCMYPPVFRDGGRTQLNKQALAKSIEFCGRKGALVGLHPEGTRGKGPDPYQLLPARPGVGEVALKASPTVLPVFINGLGNDFGEQLMSNFRTGERRGTPIVAVFGDPVDLSPFDGQTARPAIYKRVADHILDAIRALSVRERELRADIEERERKLRGGNGR